MADLTTAQRLAAYRDELRAAGFTEVEVSRFVETAAPSLPEDVEVQADLDDDGSPIGEVTVRFKPHVDEDDVARVVEQVHAVVSRAAEGE